MWTRSWYLNDVGLLLGHGEILALRWSDIDAARQLAQVRRTLLATNEGLIFEQPKTRRSKSVVPPLAPARPRALPRLL